MNNSWYTQEKRVVIKGRSGSAMRKAVNWWQQYAGRVPASVYFIRRRPVVHGDVIWAVRHPNKTRTEEDIRAEINRHFSGYKFVTNTYSNDIKQKKWLRENYFENKEEGQ